MAGGRPSKFKPEFVSQARKLAEHGLTNREIADFLEVDIATLYRWQGEKEGFCDALKAGKAPADDRVERSLYQMAVGYDQDAVKIFMPANADKPVYAKYLEKVQPSAVAAIFWLKNRRPELWRDKPEGSDDDGPAPAAVTVNIVSGRKNANA
jgi:hypothetical protein